MSYVKSTANSISLWKGLTLQTTKWEPETPKALLYISHGVAEHMGRYEKLAQHLASNGVLVFGHDHIGHGNSGGDRVHIENYKDYVADVIQSVEAMKKELPALPCFLMGHSMGGLVAALVALERQDLFIGLVLSGPMVELDPKAAGWFIVTMARLLAMVAPQFGIKQLNKDDISSVPEEIQMYDDDPLIYHGAMKAKWASSSVAAVSSFRPDVGGIKLPLLLIHGTDDHLVPISASEFLVDNVSSSDVKFEKFVNSRHEIFHDIEQDRACSVVGDWILNHTT